MLVKTSSSILGSGNAGKLYILIQWKKQASDKKVNKTGEY